MEHVESNDPVETYIVWKKNWTSTKVSICLVYTVDFKKPPFEISKCEITSCMTVVIRISPSKRHSPVIGMVVKHLIWLLHAFFHA